MEGVGLMHQHIDVDLNNIRRVGLRTDAPLLPRTVDCILGHNGR